MRQKLLDILERRKGDISLKWYEDLETQGALVGVPDVEKEDLIKRGHQIINGIMEGIAYNNSQPLSQTMKERARSRVRQNVPLGKITYIVYDVKKAIMKIVWEEMGSHDYFFDAWQLVEEWVNFGVSEMAEYYIEIREQTINLQKIALTELSAPLVPVLENISVMPLVGTIDTERAKRIMENLLEGVIKYESQVVLIDITGVPIVDTMVAHHIIKAVEAVRLVGAQCVLVGIRPEIAQTIVTLGVDMSSFPTKSTLRRGINYALEVTGRKVVSKEDEDELKRYS